MRKSGLLAVLSVAALLVLATIAGATTLPLFPKTSDPSAVDVSVDIRPTSARSPIQPLRRGGQDSAYYVTADVRNATGAGAHLQRLTVYPGQEEVRTESTGGLDVKLLASVSPDGSRAETTVTVHRAGKLLTNQHSSVWLVPSEANAPVQPVR